MVRESLLVCSMATAAFACGCSGKVILGAGAPSSDASVPDGAVSCPTGDSLSGADVPQGEPCAPTSTACEFLAAMDCAVNGWECTCKNDAWDCFISSQGEGACGPDAASDAPTADVSQSLDATPNREACAPSGCNSCLSISLNPTVLRYLPGSDATANEWPFRPQNMDPTAIDYDDCIANIHLAFDLIVSGLPCTDTLQVWVGTTDCTPTFARQPNSGATQCWPVASTTALQQMFAMDIRAQDLVAFFDVPDPPSTYTPQGDGVCHSLVGDCGVASLSVYFMAMEPDGLTVDGTPAMYSFDAEITAPDGGSCP